MLVHKSLSLGASETLMPNSLQRQNKNLLGKGGRGLSMQVIHTMCNMSNKDTQYKV